MPTGVLGNNVGEPTPSSYPAQRCGRTKNTHLRSYVVGDAAVPAGERARSFAIVTTAPNALCAELHNRMPVVLGRKACLVWLGEEPAVPSA
jgi:putative SOS response-associated peptidase YedK